MPADDPYLDADDAPAPRPVRTAGARPINRRRHKAAAARVLTAGLSTSGMFAIIGTLAANHPVASAAAANVNTSTGAPASSSTSYRSATPSSTAAGGASAS